MPVQTRLQSRRLRGPARSRKRKAASKNRQYGKSPTVAKVKAAKRARIRGDCSIEPKAFFRFVTWISEGKNLTLSDDDLMASGEDEGKEDLEYTADEDLDEFTLACEDNDDEEEEIRQGEIDSMVHRRKRWLNARDWDGTPTWFCHYIRTKLGLPPSLWVTSYLGNGVNSAVLSVKVGESVMALKVTRKGVPTSDMEVTVHQKLGDHGLSPRLLREFSNRDFCFQLLQPIRRTLGQLMERPRKFKLAELAIWKDQIMHLINGMAKLNITHGDLHLDNIGITPDHQLTLIDFDRSSTRRFVPGYDLAYMLDAMQPYRVMVDGKCVHAQFVTALIKALMKELPKNWKAGRNKVDLAKTNKYGWLWRSSFERNVTLAQLRRVAND